MRASFSLPGLLLAAAVTAGAASQAQAQGFLDLFKPQPDVTETKGARKAAPAPRRVANMAHVMKRARSFMQSKRCPLGAPVYFRAYKHEKTVEMWAQCDGPGTPYKMLAEFKMTASVGDLGFKQYEGDNQIPEGLRNIGAFNQASIEYLSFDMGYPDPLDQVRFAAFRKANPKNQAGEPYAIGGATMLHGGAATVGCIPIGDDNMEIAYGAAKAYRDAQADAPIPFHIFPFRMTAENLAHFSRQKKYQRFASYWRNLFELDAYFQANKRPPQVTVTGSQYALLHRAVEPKISIARVEREPLAITITPLPRKKQEPAPIETGAQDRVIAKARLPQIFGVAQAKEQPAAIYDLSARGRITLVKTRVINGASPTFHACALADWTKPIDDKLAAECSGPNPANLYRCPDGQMREWKYGVSKTADFRGCRPAGLDFAFNPD